MNIYEALSHDHRHFEKILDRLHRSCKQGGEGWKEHLDQLRGGLIPHAHAEEAVFYNALRETEESTGAIADSYTEHLLAETELRGLEALKIFDRTSLALVEKLRSDLHHHIQEEEGRVFKAGHRVFSAKEADQLGAAFLRLKEEMSKTAESVTASSIALVANLLPPRLKKGFEAALAKLSGKKAA